MWTSGLTTRPRDAGAERPLQRRARSVARAPFAEEAPEDVVEVAEHQLDVLLGVLARQRSQGRLEKRRRIDARRSAAPPTSVIHVAPRATGSFSSSTCQQIRPASLVEHEAAVGKSAAGRQHEIAPRTASATSGTSVRSLFISSGTTRASAGVPHQHFHLLGPRAANGRLSGRAATKRDLTAALRVGLPLGPHERPARFFDPDAAPRRQIAIGSLVEHPDQIQPGRVSELRIASGRRGGRPAACPRRAGARVAASRSALSDR